MYDDIVVLDARSNLDLEHCRIQRGADSERVYTYAPSQHQKRRIRVQDHYEVGNSMYKELSFLSGRHIRRVRGTVPWLESCSQRASACFLCEPMTTATFIGTPGLQ